MVCGNNYLYSSCFFISPYKMLRRPCKRKWYVTRNSEYIVAVHEYILMEYVNDTFDTFVYINNSIQF